MVVLPWLACIHRSAYRFLFDGGEAGDVIYGNRSPPTAFYRHQATFFDGKSDGKLCALRQEIVLFQSLKRAGDN